MFKNLLLFIPLSLAVGAVQVHAGMLPVPGLTPTVEQYAAQNVLAKDEMNLTNRHAVPVINEVFADNILLTLNYMSGRVSDAAAINWDEVRKEQRHEIVLKPGEVFAYHDGVRAEYADKVVATTNAHFGAADGFKSSGYLYGDGVCHLASLLNRAAKSAGLNVVAPANHDFARIPDIAREFGTAIYYMPGQPATSEFQNLYIENTLEETVIIDIVSNQQNVSVTIAKLK